MPAVGPPTTGYVTVADIREYGPDLVNIADAKLDAARQWFETKFEGYIGVALVPRTATATLNGSGTVALGLPHYPVRSIISVSTYVGSTLTEFTVDELADLDPSDTGYVYRRSLGSWTLGRRNVVVEYEHGLGDDVPLDVVDAALVAIHDKLLADGTAARSNRQFSVATEAGVVRSSTPGPDQPFGIPIVDECANFYRDLYWVPAVA